MKRLKGLYKNSDPRDIPEGFYADAKNIVIDETVGAITNELGNTLQNVLPSGNKLIGSQLLDDDSVILFSTPISLNDQVEGTGKHEIGVFKDGVYRTISQEDVVEKYLQIKHIISTQGTKRTVVPVGYFNMSHDLSNEAILEYDIFFEEVWNFNTIGQDGALMEQYLQDYFGRTQQQAEDEVNSLTNDREDIDEDFENTGFPFNVVKLFGLANHYDRENTAGPTSPAFVPNGKDWSVRISAIRGMYNNGLVSTHEYTSGASSQAANPAIGPTLALYIYDQTRSAGDNGHYYHIDIDTFEDSQNRKGLQKNTWYRVQLRVVVNGLGQSNGQAHLKVFERDEDLVNPIGEVSVTNLTLHNSASNDVKIGNFMFNTFFGGGSIRFTPYLDPNWTPTLVTVNNGVFMRVTNIKIEKVNG